MSMSLPMSHMRHRQSINCSSAVTAGLVGTVAATALFYLAHAAGVLKLDELRLLGGGLVAPGSNPYVMGAVLDLIVGIVFAVGYAIFFTETGIDPWWASGAGVGLAHGLFAAVVLVSTRHLSALVAGGAEAIGVFVAIHICYGAIVGAMYTESWPEGVTTSRTVSRSGGRKTEHEARSTRHARKRVRG